MPRPLAGPQAKGTPSACTRHRWSSSSFSGRKVLAERACGARAAREHRSRPLSLPWKPHRTDEQGQVFWGSRVATSRTSSTGPWEGHAACLGARPAGQGRGEPGWPSRCPLPRRPVAPRAYTPGALRHLGVLHTPVKPHPADRAGASGTPGGRRLGAGRPHGWRWAGPPGLPTAVIPDEAAVSAPSARQAYCKRNHFLIRFADGLPITAFQGKASGRQQTL